MGAGNLFVRALVLLCFTTGCELGWKTVVEKGAPGLFVWQGKTLWGAGGDSVLRRTGPGAWERVELCAPFHMSTYYSNTRLTVNVAFEGEVVWALCGDNPLVDAQTLMRHDGRGNATAIQLPSDGSIRLIPVENGPPSLVGARSLWQWDGTAFQNKGDHLLAGRGSVGYGAGLSANEIYVEDASTSESGLIWWNGTKWSAMIGASAGAPTLRFGKVWSGLLMLETGYYTPLAFKGEKALKDKGLVLSSLMTPTRALAAGKGGTEYFSIGVDDAEPVPLGRAPFGGSTGATPDVTVVDVYGNASTVFGSYGSGSGVGLAYAVDETTVLLGVTTSKAGYASDKATDNALLEGRL